MLLDILGSDLYLIFVRSFVESSELGSCIPGSVDLYVHFLRILSEDPGKQEMIG